MGVAYGNGGPTIGISLEMVCSAVQSKIDQSFIIVKQSYLSI